MSRRYNIFISILAIAAAVSCTKSDIVGSMSTSSEIGFETYLGRDAQTKATVVTTELLKKNKGQGIGIYGFYTGADSWTETTAANILINDNLYYDEGWKYDDTAFWTNNKDKYSFLAYAPYGNSAVTAKQEAGKAPQVDYNVPDALGSQVDLVYSNTRADANGANGHVNMVRPSNGTVSLNFQHALSRITVKANAVMYDKKGAVVTTPAENQEYDNIYTIKNISIEGTFNTSGTLNLATGAWGSFGLTTNKLYDLTGNLGNGIAMTSDYYDFSGTKYNTDGTVASFGSNYLMIIPKDFTTDPATLYVTYAVTIRGLESDPITKKLSIATNFEKGKAYSISLNFQREYSNTISFKVDTIPAWDEEEVTLSPSTTAN